MTLKNPKIFTAGFGCKKCGTYLHVVVSLEREIEGRFKGDVVLSARLDVNLLEETGVGDHLVAVDDVHEGLLEGVLLDARHVEAVDVIPPVDLVVLVLPVFDGGHVEGGTVGEHQTGGGQPLVSKRGSVPC